MANYTPTFTKPYPNGWVDKPSKTTPATAAIMNSYDTAIAALEAYLRDNAIDTVSVSVEQFPSDGRQWIGTITVGSDQYRIYMPSLKYENSVSDGIKIGTITLGEQSFDVYAPSSSAGGSTVSVVPKTLTGTNIAEITVDGTTYQLYAPTGGSGSGSTVTAEATLTEGTQIGKITIDGTETILYAPTASAITVDAELSATSENAIQNKVVDAAVKNLQQQIDAGGTGGSITVDYALSTTSENPVQNKVVTAELNKKIETLEDESQAPDVVNFDLDSELSLTSVKGVQNKAIAEEFQKYANGTKVVAKAAADEEGNNIKSTYVKKTEVPSGSIADAELSETSTNPVQNKVVTAELNNIKEELGVNTSNDNLWLDAYTKDKYTYDYPQPSDLGADAYSKYYPNTQISSEELRHYIGLGKYRLSFYAKLYSELETPASMPLKITCIYKDFSRLEKTITITNNEQYFEIDFDFDKSVTEMQLYVKAGQCLIKNVTLLCMSNVEEKIDKLRKALCDLGK